MMNEMTQYLKEVATLECQLYTQNRLLSKLKGRASQLGIAKHYAKPVLETSYAAPDLGLTGILALVIGLSIYMLLVIGVLPKILPKRFLVAHNEFFIMVLPVLMIVFVFVVLIILHNKREKSARKASYKWKLDQYNAAIQQDQKRVQRELPVKQALETQINHVVYQKESTEKVLASLYAVGIIHPNYRNLVAVSTFYDYFDTGRCSALTGPGGAYDVYGYESYLGRIETKLDVIINKLDEIIANQQYIGGLLQNANNVLGRIEWQNNQMMKSMSHIEENTALTEYNTYCAMQNSEIMQNIMVYQFLKR